MDPKPSLSKPRLVKVRKHLPSTRARPPSAPDNPFQSPASTPGNIHSTFVFGATTNHHGILDGLPDQIKKLNLQPESTQNHAQGLMSTLPLDLNTGDSESNNDPVVGGSLSEGGFAAGLSSEMHKLKLQRPDSDANATFLFGEGVHNFDPSGFLFGSGRKAASNSSMGSGEGSFIHLPDEMRKLNLRSSSKKKVYQKTDISNKFGGGENVANASAIGVANKLREELKKLNIGKKAATTSNKDGEELSAGDFVAGSSSSASSISRQAPPTSVFTSLDKGTIADLPDYTKKWEAQGSRQAFISRNIMESNFGNKVDSVPGFVFGNGDSASVSAGGTAGNSYIGNRAENLASSTDQFLHMDGPRTSEPSPFKFTSQTGQNEQTSKTGYFPQSGSNENTNPTPIATPSAYLSSSGHPVGSDFTSRSTYLGLGTSQVDFRIQKPDTYSFSEENLCSSLRQSLGFGSKEDAKCTKTRKRRGKLKQRVPVAKQFQSQENSSLENQEQEPSGSYSPMDYSPYPENVVADQHSTETSAASGESTHLLYNCASSDSHISSSMDARTENISVSMGGTEESLVSAAQRMSINDADLKDAEEGTSARGNSGVSTEYGSAGLDNDKPSASFEAESAGTFTSNSNTEAGGGRSFFTFSTLEDETKSNLTFVTSPFEQNLLSPSALRSRRKNRLKTGQDACFPTTKAKDPLASPAPNWFPVPSTSVDPDPQKGRSTITLSCKTQDDNNAEKNRKPDASQESIIKATPSIAAKDACEKWRLRGNQAYANGHLSKAEDYYTRGVNAASLDEVSGSCSQVLILCHSNRAATRMSLGRIREAIIDCKIALTLDPKFLRAQVRVGNCYLALGEIKDAVEHFRYCLQSKNEINCDKKIVLDASEGLKKAQQVGDCMNQSLELLLKRSRNDATKALQIISEALSISPNSESLLEMKAEALLMVRSYEEVIKMCESTLVSAEKNSVLIGDNKQLKDTENSENQNVSPERLWRWRVISMSHFYLGKFEDALELLQKHEKVQPVAGRFWNKSQEPSRSLSVIICELLRFKVSGNEAFQAGKHLEAVEHYTSALACNTESRPFTAICFCNRAAAYQALGQITDAIADCSLAIALDSSYAKAISRKATLHELIRDYGQAVNDLNRLISLLENQSEDKDIVSGESVRSTKNCNELKRARIRLLAMEDQARKGIPLDMYMILGVDPTSSAADVKKAYRKAALRHHPDKAGHYLTRSENANDGLWREVAVEVRGDADRLFKMIGEAYAVLSDSAKRLQYDEEHEMRNALKKSYTGGDSRVDPYGSPYDRSFDRRQWRPYGSSSQRWSESSYFNR